MTLKEKYPNEYFVHWISMLNATECPLTVDGFKQQCAVYIEFEGECSVSRDARRTKAYYAR